MSRIVRLRNMLETQGLTLLLQVAVLAVVVRSVEAAQWVESPPLVVIVLVAALLAAIVGSRRKQRFAYHLIVLALGALVAYLSAVYLTEALSWDLKFDALHSRLGEWWLAVTGEDATNDTLPLSLILVMIAWLAAYATSWTLFRYGNVWITLFSIGTGMLINLTYLPDSFFIYMLAFLFLGLLLLVHTTGLKRRELLQAQGKTYPAAMHRLSLLMGLLLSAVTLGATALVPMADSDTKPLKWALRPIDSVVDDVRGQLHRVFASVPGHRLASLRFFGPVLPLVRPVPTGEDHVLSSNSRFPFYWPAVAYDEYTSKAWKVEDTEERRLSTYGPTQPEEEEEGLEISAFTDSSLAYWVEMHVDSPYLMVGGKPILVEPGAEQQIPITESYNLDLINMDVNEGLPPDVVAMATDMSASAASAGELALADIPSDLIVTRLTKELSSGSTYELQIESNSTSYYPELGQALQRQGKTVGMEVTRTPIGISPVLYKPIEPLRPNSTYRIVAELNLASEESMRNATQDYYPGILNRYLQIPDTLPPRVVRLAAALTEGSPTPYDSALAIEAFLRTMEYTTVQAPIDHDADVVDQFLFESRKGYSDHFASSMAVMLRTLGIPTRMVLGFGHGSANPDEDGFLVKDRDSHSWPEVFFPNIGWVPFEPTPIYDLRPRALPGGGFNFADLGIGELGPDAQTSVSELLQAEEELQERDDFGGELPGGQGNRALPIRHFGTPLGSGGVLFVAFMAIGILLLRFFWTRQYGEFSTPEMAYSRIHRLVVFLGIPCPTSQTPFEFADILSGLLPGSKEDIDLICRTFVERRYGRKNPSAVEVIRMLWAWRRIKRALMDLRLRPERTSVSPV